ncbi:MAG: hypothetical protein J6U41_08590 [Lachnospiraceae bacterium]|nr:hypothetical protein [Lachnospiraceae bacterium]
MLAVILKILSVIGIVLLCLLGLILVLVLLVLVMPVKYRIKASKEAESELNAVFRLTYFFRIVRALAVYEQKKVSVSVKVLWFKLFSMEFPDDSEEDEISDEEFDTFLEDELPDEDDFEITTDNENADTDEMSYEPAPMESEVSDDELHNDLFGSNEETSDDGEGTTDMPEGGSYSEQDDAGSGCEDASDESGPGDDDASNGFFDRISGLIEKIKCKYRAFYDKIVKVRSEIRYYRNVLNSNEAVYALRVVKKRLKKIFKLILPRKIRCDLIYGFSSPDLTGKVYGIYCLLRNRFDKRSRVVPDFDKAVFEGYIEAKGHFNLICILHNLVCIVLNKNCRKIYRSVKHHRNKAEHEAGKDIEESTSKEAA